MNSDVTLLQIPPNAVYLFISLLTQLSLIFYCLGHSAKSTDKNALLRFLFIWTNYNFCLCIGEIYLDTHDVTRGLRLPEEIFWEQVWSTAAVGIGPSLTAFLFQFMKRDATVLIRTITGLAVISVFAIWIYPDLSDRSSSLGAIVSLPVLVLPLTYAVAMMCYVFFTTKNARLKRRLSLVLLSFGIFVLGLIPFTVIVAMEEMKEFIANYRHVATLFMTLQLTFLFTLAITRYGALEIGIEDAAEDMFRQMRDPVFVVLSSGAISRANPAARKLFEIEESDISRPITEWVPNFDPTSSRFETSIQISREEYIYFCTLTAIRKGEERIGNVLVLRDITEEKRIIFMKNAFLSTVSHELRTPLTSILGFTKIIHKKWQKVISPIFLPENKREERAKKQVSKNVDVIISEGERLTALINNVLDITKMESGTIDWNYEQTTILAIVEQAIAATQGLFSQKEVSLTTKLEEADIEVLVDKDRLIQVLLNLISNAVKFTERGSIVLNVHRRPQEVVLSVQDSGVGMKPKDVEKVFDKYQQVGADSGLQKGTGLGLPISKDIVEGHGGTIWAESELGKGSTFYFTIPLSRTQNQSIQTVAEPELLLQLKTISQVNRGSTRHVLIVDDESSIRQLVRQSLEPLGYRIQEVSNGLKALEAIKKLPPDLIVSDVMMPKMNGFDLAAILKKDMAFMHIPIVMLTVVPDEKRGYGIGVERYLRKPISPDRLREEIEDVFAQQATKPHILIAGEETETLRVLCDKVQAMGYVTHMISSAEQWASLKGIRLSMIVVESGFLLPSALQRMLYNIGQGSVLIRFFERDADALKSHANHRTR